jgi:hypothetical protein
VTRVCFVVGLALWAALAVVGCSERFMAPPLPDLHKDPYDFAVEVPPYTGPGADMAKAQPHDMAAAPTD